MKILVLNDFPIYPVDHGGKVRISSIYGNISTSNNITYLCFGDNSLIEENSISTTFIEIKIPKSLIHKKMIEFGLKIFERSIDDLIAMIVGKYNKKMKIAIQKYIKECEVVILAHPYMYPVLLPHISNNHLLIYEAYNVEFVLKESIIRNKKLSKIILKRLYNVEKTLSNECHLCFTTSEPDKQALCKFYGTSRSKVIVAPNGVNPEIYPPKNTRYCSYEGATILGPLVIFLGSGHYPNVEAAFVLIREIAPRMPDISFLICGSVCWGVQHEPMGKNVGLAYVISDEEKMELFRIADVAINPMMSGSGTNIKMLDFMAAGLPVVSTETGARGLAIQDGIHGLICSIEEFPDRIRRLLADCALYRIISDNGKKLVEDSYDWKKIASLMIEAIEKEKNQLFQ
jgi:glycosyltransferase involved in cell wall biosynthesis